MAWTLTSSLGDFLDAAGPYLRLDPVQNTVQLTVLETLRLSGTSHYGELAPAFGWHESAAGAVDGAFLHTPPYPVLVGRLPAGTAPSLMRLLAGRQPTAANVLGSDEADVIAAWAAVTGGRATGGSRSRLFRLAGLTPHEPAPDGAARVAGTDDQGLLTDWYEAFGAEAGVVGEHAERAVADKLSHGGLMIWEVAGLPVAMAGLTRSVAGVVRVVAVYTVPAQRQRGYGGAITTAVSQAALDAGAAEVVLFTDLANPTSNALYKRLGYRPVADRLVLAFAPAVASPA